MQTYKAMDGERLDIIVFRHYRNLSVFEKVLEINAKCEPILKAGEAVILPEIKDEPIIKENALWD